MHTIHTNTGKAKASHPGPTIKAATGTKNWAALAASNAVQPPASQQTGQVHQASLQKKASEKPAHSPVAVPKDQSTTKAGNNEPSPNNHGNSKRDIVGEVKKDNKAGVNGRVEHDKNITQGHAAHAIQAENKTETGRKHASANSHNNTTRISENSVRNDQDKKRDAQQQQKQCQADANTSPVQKHSTQAVDSSTYKDRAEKNAHKEQVAQELLHSIDGQRNNTHVQEKQNQQQNGGKHVQNGGKHVDVQRTDISKQHGEVHGKAEAGKANQAAHQQPRVVGLT
jgi:hypothetical protein